MNTPKFSPATVEVERVGSSNSQSRLDLNSNSGLDLFASEDVFIKTGETAVIKTGLSVSLPCDVYGRIDIKNSLATTGLLSTGGMVDVGYTGELNVVVHNLNNRINSSYVGMGYQIKKGQKIAQLLVQHVAPIRLREVESLALNERGISGFDNNGR